MCAGAQPDGKKARKAGSRMVYCIPFNMVVKIEKVDRVKNLNMPRENLCASMFPKEVYCVYFIVEKKEAVFIECDERFAQEIQRRINENSEVRDEE